MILESVVDAGRLFQIVGAAMEKTLQAVTDFLAETVGTVNFCSLMMSGVILSGCNFEQTEQAMKVAVSGEF